MSISRSGLRALARNAASVRASTSYAPMRWESTAAPTSPSKLAESPAPAPAAKAPPSKLLVGVAKFLGYSAANTMAIRSTNAYYNYISEQHRRDWDFWYDECHLQQSFQAWFQITNLYLYILTVRLRALDKPFGRRFLQEMVNHFFIDAEYRMQSDYDIKKSRYIKNTLQTMLAQHHGSVLAYDEALIGSDAQMAAAVWRNVFGAGWGVGMGGVEGKKPPKLSKSAQLDGPKFEVQEPLDAAKDSAILDPAEIVRREAKFAVALEHIVRLVRSEVHRLDQLPDMVVMDGPSEGNLEAVHFARLSPAPAKSP